MCLAAKDIARFYEPKPLSPLSQTPTISPHSESVKQSSHTDVLFLRSILILSSCLCLSHPIVLRDFSPTILYYFLISPRMCYVPLALQHNLMTVTELHKE
jgi:hypothetical protein